MKFNDTKEDYERRLMSILKESFGRYKEHEKGGGHLEERVQSIVRRFRMAIRGRESRWQDVFDFDWIAYEDILNQFEKADPSKVENKEMLAGMRNVIFAYFGDVPPRGILSFDHFMLTGMKRDSATYEAFDEWFEENQITFTRGAEGMEHDVMFCYQGKAFRRVPHGVVNLYPAFGANQKIVGFLCLDADGDVSLNFSQGVGEFTALEADLDFDSEIKFEECEKRQREKRKQSFLNDLFSKKKDTPKIRGVRFDSKGNKFVETE